MDQEHGGIGDEASQDTVPVDGEAAAAEAGVLHRDGCRARPAGGLGLVWWVAGLADGAFSVLHFLAFIAGGLLGVTLLSIADSEDGE